MVVLLAGLAAGCVARKAAPGVAEPPVATWTDADLGLSTERVPLGEVVQGALVRHDLGGLGELWTAHETPWRNQYALVVQGGPPTIPDFVEPGGRRLGGRQRPTSDAENPWGLRARAHRIRARVVERGDGLHPVLADIELLDDERGTVPIGALLTNLHARFIVDSAPLRAQAEQGWAAERIEAQGLPSATLRLALDAEARRWEVVWVGTLQARTPLEPVAGPTDCPACPCTPEGTCAPCIPCMAPPPTIPRTQVDQVRWAVRYQVDLDGRVTAKTRFAPQVSREIIEGQLRPAAR